MKCLSDGTEFLESCFVVLEETFQVEACPFFRVRADEAAQTTVLVGVVIRVAECGRFETMLCQQGSDLLRLYSVFRLDGSRSVRRWRRTEVRMVGALYLPKVVKGPVALDFRKLLRCWVGIRFVSSLFWSKSDEGRDYCQTDDDNDDCVSHYSLSF